MTQRQFYVPRPLPMQPFVGSEAAPLTPDIATPRDISIPVVARAWQVNERINLRYEATGVLPDEILLGWETWLQLGWEMSGGKAALNPVEFRGIPLLVDYQRKQRIEALYRPSFRNLEMVQ